MRLFCTALLTGFSSPAVHPQDQGEQTQNDSFRHETREPNPAGEDKADSVGPPQGPPYKDGISWRASAGNLWQFNGAIDGGGQFSVDRTYVQAAFDHTVSPQFSWGAGLATEVDAYDFSGNGAFNDAAGGTPWTTTVDLTLKTSMKLNLNRKWQIRASVFCGWAGEHDAVFDDSFTVGAILGAAYRFDDTLTLGVGSLISDRLEDGLLVIPSVIVDWKITPKLTLSNVRGAASYPTSAGAELVYAFGKTTSISLGARYEYRRFRLDGEGAPPTQGGVGTERSLPTWLRFEYNPAPNIRLHLVGGISFGEKLELQNRNGETVAEQGVDPMPFIAFFAGIRF